MFATPLDMSAGPPPSQVRFPAHSHKVSVPHGNIFGLPFWATLGPLFTPSTAFAPASICTFYVVYIPGFAPTAPEEAGTVTGNNPQGPVRAGRPFASSVSVVTTSARLGSAAETGRSETKRARQARIFFLEPVPRFWADSIAVSASNSSS